LLQQRDAGNEARLVVSFGAKASLLGIVLKLQTRKPEIMMRLRKFLLFLIIAVALGIAETSSAKGDPLLFSNVVALQNAGATKVDLFSNPGTTLIGPRVSFLVDISGMLPPGVTNTLLITYNELGSSPITQSFQIPAFGTIQPPFTQLFTITSPGASLPGTFATLTIDILGSSPDFVIPTGPGMGREVNSYTYSFNVSQPVPEPGAVILLSSGLIGLFSGGLIKVARKTRRRSGGEVK
jgi:hypothetical protein